MTTSLCELISTDQPIVMGILNTTPDSFSDGGRFEQIDVAVQHALQMQAEGAQIIDVGGESTRPGAEAVSVEDELQRVIPLIESLRQRSDVIISIDTSKPEVMRAAVAAGANLVNDVTALRAPGALEVCAELDVPVCLMHMQGEPRSMQNDPSYRNVVTEVSEFLQQRKQAAMAAGIGEERILLDPGFGFGKNLTHNLQLLKQLDQLQSLDSPLLVGLSRKSMFAAILGEAAVDQRLYASVAAAVLCWDRGARLFRVHDVKATVDALKVCSAMQQA
jgi:dihydropteroate synthase